MHKSLYIALALLACLSANGQLQQDPEARKILDRFSSKSTADYPVQIHFEYVYESLIDQETHTETGTLILQNEQFRLRFGEADVYCDGKTIWNHLTLAGEVYISDAEDARGTDDFFISSPQDLFTFYQEYFKFQLKGEIEHQDRQYYQIYLYPDDLDRRYHTIKLLISTGDFRLYSAEALGKYGVNHSVIIGEYRKKVKTDENTFVFRPGCHPDLEVIDTRF